MKIFPIAAVLNLKSLYKEISILWGRAHQEILKWEWSNRCMFPGRDGNALFNFAFDATAGPAQWYLRVVQIINSKLAQIAFVRNRRWICRLPHSWNIHAKLNLTGERGWKVRWLYTFLIKYSRRLCQQLQCNLHHSLLYFVNQLLGCK